MTTLLFDGNYLFHRDLAVWARNYLTTGGGGTGTGGQDLNAGLADPVQRAMLIRKCTIDLCAIVRRFGGEDGAVGRVVVIIDSRSWRHNFVSDYKRCLTGGPSTIDHELFIQTLNAWAGALQRAGIPVSRVAGAEGDDLLFTWSLACGYCWNEDVVIVSGDNDLLQLIDENVAVYHAHSRGLRLYCRRGRECYWTERLPTDVVVTVVNPIDTVLEKVVLGCHSDNVPGLIRGFGEVRFRRWLNGLEGRRPPRTGRFMDLAVWIADALAPTLHKDSFELLGAVIRNLQVTWLALDVYTEGNWRTRDGASLLEHMLEDVNRHKDSFRYNKGWTMEGVLNLPIK